MSFHLLIQGHTPRYSSMWAVWSKSDRRKGGDSLELLSLSLLDVRHSARAQQSKWSTISETIQPVSNPRHYLWNNCHQSQAGGGRRKLIFYPSVIIKGKRKQKCQLVQQPCSHNIRGSGFGLRAIVNSRVSWDCFLNVPQIPSSRVLSIVWWRTLKNKSSVRRRQQTNGVGGAEVVKDESHLCLTLSDKTMLDTHCNDPLSECNAYSPSPGRAYFVCAVNTEQVVLTCTQVPDCTGVLAALKGPKIHFTNIS